MKRVQLLLALIFFSMGASAQKARVKFNHISIHVNNLERSVAFYTKLFHLDSVPDPFPQYRVTWFKLSKHTQLHIFEDKNVIPQGKYHFCFSVPSLEIFLKVLDENGIPYTDSGGVKGRLTKRSDGVQQAYFFDPDGHKLEVNDDWR